MDDVMNRACLLTSFFVLLVVFGACHRKNKLDADKFYHVGNTPLLLPKEEGWVRDQNLAPLDANAGGTAMRLIRQAAIPGSPRIEVVQEAVHLQTPSILEDYLTRNLRDMGALEAAGEIHILHVEQQRINLGPLAAYRVQHEYTIGHGPGQVSLFQTSLFMVIAGRGYTVTAAGRTELFHPLAQNIDAVLSHIQILSTAQVDPNNNDIDLGRLGGNDTAQP